MGTHNPLPLGLQCSYSIPESYWVVHPLDHPNNVLAREAEPLEDDRCLKLPRLLYIFFSAVECLHQDVDYLSTIIFLTCIAVMLFAALMSKATGTCHSYFECTSVTSDSIQPVLVSIIIVESAIFKAAELLQSCQNSSWPG